MSEIEIEAYWKNPRTIIGIALMAFAVSIGITIAVTSNIVEKQTHDKTISKMKIGIENCNNYCHRERGVLFKGFIESINEKQEAECWCIPYELSRGNQTELPTENN